MGTYGIHSIHGRAPAVATGLKTARPDLNVWVVTGDGDGLSIGGNHLMHAMRRNVNLKILLFNNRIYGLTKGQYSPTSETGKKTKSSPMGSVDTPVEPIALALACGATFVARTFDTNIKHMTEVLARANEHPGVAFIEIYQNCNVFNDGAFVMFTDRKVRDDRMVELVHGKPLIFGKDGNKGVRVKNYRPEVVTIGEDGITEADLLVHDDNAPEAIATLLSRMAYPAFPVPLGIFRNDATKPSFDGMMNEQMKAARAAKQPDLQALLTGRDTWTVDEDEEA
jgi:2-oxoglutarate ferredoxin oxidoreductase subunit beta